ncbi:MAG: transcription termination/antitermination protein NusA [marine bacterium B5-7]|nr:MAG: transcription termination/antitermination protein NusA [marine bacterium B5-7]
MISNSEILLMADVVSREKGLEKEVIFQAIEAALATATRKRHSEDIEARVAIHRDTGKYDTYRQWEIIDDDAEIEFPDRQLTLSKARELKAEVEIGGFIEEALEPVEFGRIAAQAAKQVIHQKVREAERHQVFEEYQPRVGEMLSGTVKRTDRGDTVIDVGGVEAALPRSRMIPREALRPGDRIRAILEEVRLESRGPQLVLDRICPELLIKLFELEVPEAGEGIINILAAARDPGIRAKIAVRSNDRKIDPVGACVGIRGARVQSVSNEIAGERVDIIPWSDDSPTFVINALAPAMVESIILDEDTRSMDVVVQESQLSQAIGRGGQNVRLASELTGWDLNIMTDTDAAEKAEKEAGEVRDKLMTALGVDNDIAEILAQEGFTSLEEVAFVPRQELLEIEEFDEALVDELRSRASDSLLTQAIAQEEANSPAEDLLTMDGMDDETAHLLASKGVRTMEELAEYAADELTDLTGIETERAGTLIMTARAPWFEEE